MSGKMVHHHHPYHHGASGGWWGGEEGLERERTKGRDVARPCGKVTATPVRQRKVRTGAGVVHARGARGARDVECLHAPAAQRIATASVDRRARRDVLRNAGVYDAADPPAVVQAHAAGRLNVQRRGLEDLIGRVGRVGQRHVVFDARHELPSGCGLRTRCRGADVVPCDVEGGGVVRVVGVGLKLGRRDAVRRGGGEVTGGGGAGAGAVGENMVEEGEEGEKGSFFRPKGQHCGNVSELLLGGRVCR